MRELARVICDERLAITFALQFEETSLTSSVVIQGLDGVVLIICAQEFRPWRVHDRCLSLNLGGIYVFAVDCFGHDFQRFSV